MTFSGKIGPSFDSYGHSYVKNDQKLFLPWIATSNIPQTDKNWAYFGLFRPKIDQKMGSYKITFTKKWFFMPNFHLLTQIRIILDYHV